MTEWCVLGSCSNEPPTLLFISLVLQSKHGVGEAPTYLPLASLPTTLLHKKVSNKKQGEN